MTALFSVFREAWYRNGRAKPIGATRLKFLAFLGVAVALAGIIAGDVGLFSNAGAMTGQVVSLKLTGKQLSTSSYSDIIAVQGATGADGGFQRLVDLMEQRGPSFYSLVGPQDV